MASTERAPAVALALGAEEVSGSSITRPEDQEKQESSSRTCRDLLLSAAGWYATVKEYVPTVAKPVVSKIETKVGEKLDQFPDTVQKVEAFMDARIIPAAEAAAAEITKRTQEALANETVKNRVVEPGREAVRHVVDKTSEFLASERGQAIRTKATEAVKAA